MKHNAAGRWSLLLLLCIVSTFSVASAETPPNPVVSRTNREIQAIDENLGSTAIETKLFVKGDQSGVLSLYSADNRFSKLVVQLVSEQSGDVTEYYYTNGTLIYAVDACRNFGSSVRQGVMQNCATVFENRYYLLDGTLVAWLSGEGPGLLNLQPATDDVQKLAAKGVAVIRSASMWRAFVHSPSTNFDEFAKSYSP